jgi:heterodisulfide reductase subunit C
MTDVSSVVESLGFDDGELALVKEHFDYGLLSHHCGACSKECTAAIKSRDSEEPFDPMEVVGLLLEGKLNEVLESRDIWHCLQCAKCEENCPNNSGFLEFFVKLRELASEKQGSPKAVEDKLRTLKTTGYAMPKKIGIRKKMDIEPAKELDVTSIVEIIEKTKAEDGDAD